MQNWSIVYNLSLYSTEDFFPTYWGGVAMSHDLTKRIGLVEAENQGTDGDEARWKALHLFHGQWLGH